MVEFFVWMFIYFFVGALCASTLFIYGFKMDPFEDKEFLLGYIICVIVWPLVASVGLPTLAAYKIIRKVKDRG